MKRLTLLIALFGLFLIAVGCGAPPAAPTPPYVYDGVEMLQNVSVESPDMSCWQNWNGAGMTCERSSGVAATGSYSLKVTSSVDSATDGPYWYQCISTNIPVGKQLKLTVKIKTDNVVGAGASLLIRPDDSAGKSPTYAGTEDKISIIGTRDWTTYQVELTDKLTADINSIKVFLILLPHSTGTVYFDDISLIH